MDIANTFLFHGRIINTRTLAHVAIYLVMTTITELKDFPTDADPGEGGGGLRKDVKKKTAGGKSTRLAGQFSTATEGDTERAFRKSESDPGAQQPSRVEPDDGRASKCKRLHHSNSCPDGGATLPTGREGPQMSLCQVL